MALIRPSGLVNAISGAIGGQVFVAGKGAPSVRPRPTKKHIAEVSKNRDDPVLRTTFAKVAKSWSGLSSGTKLAWNNLAQQQAYLNRVGLQRKISGFNLYCSYALDVWPMANGFTSDIPLLGTTPAPLTVVAAVPTVGNTTCTVTVDSINAARRVAVYGQALMKNTASTRPPPLFYMGAFNMFFSTSTSLFFTNTWVAHNGTRILGQVCWMGARTWIPGYFPSAMTFGVTTVV